MREKCESGIEVYSLRFQRCDFKFDSGEKCMMHRASHEEEHCDREGHRKPGKFEDSASQLQFLLEPVRKKFLELYRAAFPREKIFPRLDVRRKLRQELYRKHCEWLKKLRSNKTCIACIQAVPDHVLECGHSFCDNCVREMGTPSSTFEAAWVMTHCMLCDKSCPESGQVIRFKPRRCADFIP